MVKNCLYFILGLSIGYASDCMAMKHKWQKQKGSDKKAQLHKLQQRNKPSKQEMKHQRKLAQLQMEQPPIKAQDQISSLVSVMMLQQATQNRNVR